MHWRWDPVRYMPEYTYIQELRHRMWQTFVYGSRDEGVQCLTIHWSDAHIYCSAFGATVKCTEWHRNLMVTMANVWLRSIQYGAHAFCSQSKHKRKWAPPKNKNEIGKCWFIVRYSTILNRQCYQLEKKRKNNNIRDWLYCHWALGSGHEYCVSHIRPNGNMRIV